MSQNSEQVLDPPLISVLSTVVKSIVLYIPTKGLGIIASVHH